MHKKWFILALCLALCLGIGILEGVATHTSVHTWYTTLIKPSTTPPAWVFPIVWSILYTLMAISLWLVWLSPPDDKTYAYTLFFVQLFLNFLWSWLFFYFRSPQLALIDISFLWVFIIATMMSFYRHSPLAAGLLVPYFLWVSYAIHLNFLIWLKNP